MTDWETADDFKSARALFGRLCDLGQESGGKECLDCESQCAFGRRFIQLKTRHVNPKIDKRRYAVASLDDKLRIVSIYQSLREAATDTGVHYPHVIGEAARKTGKKKAGGYYWMTIKEHEEST